MAQLKTQGTEVYLYKPSDNEMIDGGCITAIGGASAPVSQLETTCLTSEAREYMAGLREPGTSSFTLMFDPSNPDHMEIFNLYKTGEVVDIMIGFSDGTSVPTYDADADELVVPEDRTFLTYSAYVTEVPFEFELNAVLSVEVSVQISGDVNLMPANVA